MIAVVAAVITDRGRVLLGQRPEGHHLAGKWEFPGGKLEKGETPEAALERELREELGVTAEIGRILDAIPVTGGSRDDLLLLFYEARIASGEPRPIEEAQVRYFAPEELSSLDLAETDRRFIRRFIERAGDGSSFIAARCADT